MLIDLAWCWTCLGGKYTGRQFWTEAAQEQFRKDPASKLRHEHVVPKRIVIEMLLGLPDATADQVMQICERYLIGVVITPEEDRVLSKRFRQSMPAEFVQAGHPEFDDVWLRYKRCGIRVGEGTGDVSRKEDETGRRK